MRHFIIALIVAMSASLVSSQTVLVFGDNALPSCAQSCQLLQQAQAACVPPAAAVTDQTTYESCFCQSGYLSSLKTSPVGICDAACTSTTDQQQIQSWYLSNCRNNGADVAAGATSTTTDVATTPTAASTIAGTSTSASSGASSTSTSNASKSAEKGTWWSQHWKWVVMVIVLFIAFILIAVAGVLLKRRHVRRQDKIKSSFNAGITHRSTPMTTTVGPRLPYQNHGPGGGGGGVGQHGSDGANSMYLPQVRERDRRVMQQRDMRDPAVAYPPEESGSMPMEELRTGKLTKGKQRVEID